MQRVPRFGIYRAPSISKSGAGVAEENTDWEDGMLAGGDLLVPDGLSEAKTSSITLWPYKYGGTLMEMTPQSQANEQDNSSPIGFLPHVPRVIKITADYYWQAIHYHYKSHRYHAAILVSKLDRSLSLELLYIWSSPNLELRTLSGYWVYNLHTTILFDLG